ncbi:MAG: signal peptidase I [Lachnospiraceae bacterium]|jgi:signal peptidase I|uniref:Signal peptidase I n=1 Tax=Hominisplanchenecus murintestinalis TaxID=2941517 RepID=A0AC61R4D2_9FIRM|nr:signal peptidase I [Hominisplanchenecus murintestinalis]MCI9516113.1 signal peptidase I [Lachnospiraceae bacterium]RKJ97810.1 signal peptidase I [Anaerotruncus sp. 1XD22-93]MCI9660404.1 signal peptidase I [Lachnospiraceae bacterium]NBH97324.1 signal peptidase I [Lachnospiraceae bacterium]NBI74381.1 signal peptidase I [Lachnospiraceae bacterium]
MGTGEKEEKTGERTAKNMVKEVLSMALYIAVVLCITFLVVRYVGQRTQVDGHSMENTLFDGDNLIVDKISYRFTDPKRFDIIVFPYHYKEDTYYIKRIIGLPGETVQIRDGEIYIDGAILEEDYGKETMLTSGRAADQIQLGEDEYFVLGDNRNHSEDSRFDDVGNIERSEIIGRAFIRIWPFERFGLLKHQ